MAADVSTCGACDKTRTLAYRSCRPVRSSERENISRFLLLIIIWTFWTLLPLESFETCAVQRRSEIFVCCVADFVAYCVSFYINVHDFSEDTFKRYSTPFSRRSVNRSLNDEVRIASCCCRKLSRL